MATNLIVNGTFSSGTSYAPWTETGGARLPMAVVDGALESYNQFSFSVCANQVFTTLQAGEYQLTFDYWGSIEQAWDIKILPELDDRVVPPGGVWTSYSRTITLPAGVTRTLQICHGSSNQTVGRIDNVYLVPAPFQLAVTPPTTAVGPFAISTTQLAPGAAVTLYRSVAGERAKLADLTASPAGVITFNDFLYPLGSVVGYVMTDATGADVAVAGPFTAPDSVVPWLRDAVLPELLNAPTTIVDITDRLRGGRVTAYRVVARKFPVTVGDIRQASEGTLTVYCADHEARDRVIDTLSSGYPCTLRVPLACRDVVDDMMFAPLDIVETRFGTNGACTLSIDFVEADSTELPQFVATSYATQTTNANTAGLLYDDIKANFSGRIYADLYLSADGVNP